MTLFSGRFPADFRPSPCRPSLREIVRKLPTADAAITGRACSPAHLRAGRSRLAAGPAGDDFLAAAETTPAARSSGQGSVAAIGAIAYAISTEKRAPI